MTFFRLVLVFCIHIFLVVQVYGINQELLLKAVVNDDKGPVNGWFDIKLNLYTKDNDNKNQLLVTKDYSNIEVVQGVVKLTIDPLSEEQLNSDIYYYSLEIEGEELFLDIRPSLYALRATVADRVRSVVYKDIEGVPGLGAISGTLNVTQVPDRFVTDRMIGGVDVRKIRGDLGVRFSDGSALKQLNASEITTGILSNDRLSKDVTLLGNTISGSEIDKFHKFWFRNHDI